MFNNFTLSNKEILKIIRNYNGLIVQMSKRDGKTDEDLQQEIKFRIVKVLSKNRKNKT